MNLKTIDGEGRIETRLEELRAELNKGQRHLEQIEHQRQEVHDTLLRISGAILVLEELLKPAQARNSAPVSIPDPPLAPESVLAKAYG